MLRALIPTPTPTATSARRSRPKCSAATCIPPPPLTIDATRGGRRSSSLYEVLRVNHDATTTEIKAAYRSLAKVHHPDALRMGTEGGMSRCCGREFMEIHDAYATLTDPAARAVYDLTLGLGGRRRRQWNEYDNGRGGRTTRRWETDQCW